MNDTSRVAFFVPSLTVGGAQRVTVTLANGLSDRGYEVDVLLARREGDLLDELDDAVMVVDLNAPSVPALGVLTSLPRLRSYLRIVEPAVLFGVMTHANVTATLASSTTRTETKLVLVEHNTFGMEAGAKSAATDGLARFLYPIADRVVAVSKGVADSVVRATNVRREDVAVLYNPVPISEIQSAAAESIEHPWLTSSALDVIVTLGRLEPPKDYETVLDAFERVHERRPDTRLLLVGQGSRQEAIRDRADDLGLGDVVSVPGYVDNPYAFVRNASVFVLSSEYEGLPTVLIEALACGRPIVATDCPSGPREILADGEYGTLVPVGDVVALSRAITTRLNERDTDEARLRSRAQDFSVPTIAGLYAELIEQLIE